MRTPQRPLQLLDPLLLLGIGPRGCASPPKRSLGSRFYFVLPTVIEIRSNLVLTAGLSHVPALQTFQHNLPFLFRGSLDSRLSRHSRLLAEAPSLTNFRVQFYWGALHHSSLYTNGRTKFLVSPNSWAGVGAVFPNVEVRHLHAVIALGEELNFTKAALRLHLTQSALSRQITEVEEQLRFRLFLAIIDGLSVWSSPTLGESSSKRLALHCCIWSGLFISLVPPMTEQTTF